MEAASAFSFETITPKDAYELVANYTDVYILDVRTQAEWQWVGHPGVNGHDEGAVLEGKVVNIAFKIDCGVVGEKPELNLDFAEDVIDTFDSDVILITMCRSGPRGAAAAKILEGKYKVMNMEGGFEGGLDKRGYRKVGGWVNKNLPYNYQGWGYQKGTCPK